MGSFLEANDQNFTGTWRSFFCVVPNPLKQGMKTKKVSGDGVWLDFLYERLNVLCFICGCLGYTERNCSKSYDHFHAQVVQKPHGL